MKRNIYSPERLQQVFEKTDGHCHICHCRLQISKYGNTASDGGWHVDHSKPLSKGGTNHLNNLYAACAPCNINKGTKSSRSTRRELGNSRAPYSAQKKASIRTERTGAGSALGALAGGILGGPM